MLTSKTLVQAHALLHAEQLPTHAAEMVHLRPHKHLTRQHDPARKTEGLALSTYPRELGP